MKQTAVEWLFEQLCSEKLSWNKDSMGKLFIDLRTSNILQQAKEMEKEQIIEAWNIRAKIDGVLTYTDNRTAEQYYNETYESNT
jgi:hypothetical protein